MWPKNNKKYNLCRSGPNVLNFEFFFFFNFSLIILVDFFMSVQGCGQTQSLTTDAGHTLLCSAFVHFLVLYECSLCGIFLWTLITSELFLCIWCLFRPKFILFAQQVGICFCWLCSLQMSLHTWDTQG